MSEHDHDPLDALLREAAEASRREAVSNDLAHRARRRGRRRAARRGGAITGALAGVLAVWVALPLPEAGPEAGPSQPTAGVVQRDTPPAWRVESPLPVELPPATPARPAVRVTAGPGTFTETINTSQPDVTVVWVHRELAVPDARPASDRIPDTRLAGALPCPTLNRPRLSVALTPLSTPDA